MIIHNTSKQTMVSTTTTPPQDQDLLLAIPRTQATDTRRQLEEFLTVQNDRFRPVCVVSSGGTVADLEVHSVRCLDNFSTGLRGAIAVEEFLQRGYAVIHLWRIGSTSPFARVINQHVGLPQSNHPLSVECLDKLFAGDDNDDLVQAVLQREEEEWREREAGMEGREDDDHQRRDEVRLHHSLRNSTAVQRALQQKLEASAKLLTIPFRSVDEYLAKLQLCSEELNETGALAMFFLAAAVSDFYVPLSDRVEHKIQSAGGEGLTLHLKPVPKVLGKLRQQWAPDAFVVSFKLETDAGILRQKAEKAVERYGCHMVIGNLLQSRHDRVSILTPEDFATKNPTSARTWPLHVITKESGDSLESAITDFVAQSHLEFISYHFAHENKDALKRSREKIAARKAKLQREEFWRKLRETAFDASGVLMALVLSYTINNVLQHRFRTLRWE